MPAGVRLSDLLAHLESTGEVVAESAMLELASLVVNAVASLHAWPGGLAHGAINPAHVLLTNDGRVLLTDCIFGAGLRCCSATAKCSGRNSGWRCRPAASLARFDQQSDVTQMGAVILAIILQRPMRDHEYPRGDSGSHRDGDRIVNDTGHARFFFRAPSVAAGSAAGSSPARVPIRGGSAAFICGYQ
jgi:hypothetical protein